MKHRNERELAAWRAWASARPGRITLVLRELVRAGRPATYARVHAWLREGASLQHRPVGENRRAMRRVMRRLMARENSS